jgi:hypothetical protein
MRIVLTGATGFVGAEVLTRLLARPDITGVTALTRRPLAVESPKLTAVLHEDFAAYDDALLDRLAAHDGCIWALGGKESDLGHPEVLARITHTFTLALAAPLAARCRAPFSFCYLSGMGADRSETAWFPWEKSTRHLKGRTERDLLALTERWPSFSAHCFRPGGILPLGSSRLLHAVLAPIVVGVDVLAESLIDVATAKDSRGRAPLIRNGEIKRLARP